MLASLFSYVFQICNAECTVSGVTYVLMKRRRMTRQTVYVKHNNEAHWGNHCCSGEAMNITHCDCICSLRYPVCNTHVLYCYLQPAIFFTSHKCYNFLKAVVGQKLCVLTLSTNLCETCLILRRIE